MELFEELNENAKVWVYQSDRELTIEDEIRIRTALKDFVSGWNAHGTQLTGDYCIVHNRFVMLAVDESKAGASGCSIDSSVKVIKELGRELNINFFDRLQVIIEKNLEQKQIHYSNKENYPGWKMYDNTITNLGSLRKEWRKEI